MATACWMPLPEGLAITRATVPALADSLVVLNASEPSAAAERETFDEPAGGAAADPDEAFVVELEPELELPQAATPRAATTPAAGSTRCNEEEESDTGDTFR